MLVGFTALSVEIRTNVPTPLRAAQRAVRRVPTTLFHTPSSTLASSIGTCL